MVYVSRSTLQQSAARRAQSVADDQLKQLDDSIAQSKAQTEALAAPTSVAQPESAPAPSQPDASSGLPSIDDLMSEHGFSGASGSSVGIQQAQPQQEQSGFTLPTIDELMPQDLMPKREHPLVDAPESYSGALTAMGGTPEAESLTQPGGTAYVAPRATGGTGTPMAMPQARIPRDVSSGSYAPVTDDTTITKETVNQSAAAALARAGLPPSMAPYIAGIAINEGILQPGTIARDYWSVGGVKAPGSAGVITVPTREVINGESVMQMASFGKFNSMQEGMDALAEFIRDSPRFGPVARQAAETGDYSGMIEGFRQQGYATDPNWTRQVNSIASTLPDPVSSQPSQPQAGTIKGGLTVAEAQAADRGRTMAYQAPYASDESGIIYPGDEPLSGGVNASGGYDTRGIPGAPNGEVASVGDQIRHTGAGYPPARVSGDTTGDAIRVGDGGAGLLPSTDPEAGAYYSSPAGTRLAPPTAPSTQPSDTVESAAVPSPDVAPVSLGDKIKQTFSDFGSKLGELFGATNDAAVGALNQGARTAQDVWQAGADNPSTSRRVLDATVIPMAQDLASGLNESRIGYQNALSDATGGLIPEGSSDRNAEGRRVARQGAIDFAQNWMAPTSAVPEVRGLADTSEEALRRLRAEGRMMPNPASAAGIVGKESPDAGSVASAVGRSVGTGVGAAYQESQNPESTPQSILQAGARGAGVGLLNEGMRAGIGANGAARGARAVRGYDPSQSQNQVLRDQGKMFERDVPNKPEPLPFWTRMAQAWTDDRAALSHLEREAADRIGRVLKPEEMPSALTRINPEAVASQRLQDSFKPAIQTVNDAGVGSKALEQHLVLMHNMDVAESVRERATLKYLARDVPVMGEAAVTNAEKALDMAEKRLDDLTSAARTPAAVEHTAYRKALDRAQAEAERLQEQAASIRQKQWESQLGQSAKTLQQAQDELDRIHALRDTAAEPEPAAYARMIKDAEQRVETASGQFDRAQEVFANRVGQQETDMAERSLARAERYRSRVEAIQSNERDRLLTRADDAVARAQQRVAKAYELRDMGIQQRVERAMNIGDDAAETRAFSGGYTLSDMRQALGALQEEITAQYGTQGWQAVQDASDQIWKLNAETLQRKGQAGLLPEETVQALLQRYPHYVRTDIVDWVKDGQAGGTGPSRRLGVSSAPIQGISMKGTSKDRVNPLWSTVVQTRDAERMIARNQALNALLDLREQDPVLQRIIREVAGPRAAAQKGIPIGEAAMGGEKALTGYRNGERVRYAVGKELSAVFDPAMFERIPEAWRMWMSLYKQAITGRNPGFLAINMFRDAYDAVVMATAAEGGPQNLARVLTEYGKAIPTAFDGIFRGEYRGTAAELRRSGMGMGGVKNDFTEAKKLIDDYGRSNVLEVRTPADLARIAKDLVTNEWVAGLNDRIEMVPRVARAELARQNGAGPIERMIAARDASIDFERGGELSKAINQIVPFFNPVMQGGAQMARTLKANPGPAAATIGTSVGLPVFAAEIYNRSDPQRAKDYEDVPRYLRDNGIVLMTGFEGTDAQGNRRPNFIWIPTGIFTPFAIAAREATGSIMGANDTRLKDPGEWKELGLALAGSVSPIKTDLGQGLSQIIPPPVSTAAEILTNRDLYRGSTIASENRDQDAAPLSKALSAALDKIGVQLRPSQVDYIVRDLTGAFGQEALGASEMAAGTPKDQQRPFQTVPVAGGIVGRFVRDSIGQKLQNARDDMISPSVRQALRDAGMRDDELSGVSSSVRGYQFTREQQATAQEWMNTFLEIEVEKTLRSSEYMRPTADREALIRAAASRAREKARQQVLKSIPRALRQGS